ncbi:Uncharacterised protein [Arcanobacterium haemolyticum]|nr:Uncharacterised protein [Arcanobacterium haemolyticum]
MWWFVECELGTRTVEDRQVFEFVTGDPDQEAFKDVEHDAGLGVVGLEFVAYFRVEVIEDFRPCLLHLTIDLFRVPFLEFGERCIDLGSSLAIIEDAPDVLLKVQTVFDLPQHFIGCAKHGREQLELFGQ